ncbi:LacI family DNA-binding transcriptional regulator [Sphingomonas sp. ASV193]|uniref:LacI family DNA-binding transcriptional regulator n=1 Tax=Sphingomonas sp. ASV193 TaxID=3144405 RepID=UPI0032E92D27
MNRGSATIDDVAAAAGVARVTVSRVLNNAASVRAETRERVMRAVESLGYSVNHQARALASGGAQPILLVHAHNPDREPNSYYHSALELGAMRGCAGAGLDLVTASIDPDGDDPAGQLRRLVERQRPAGIILCPPLADQPAVLALAAETATPLFAISAGPEAAELVPAIGIDERAAGRAVGEHLLALGHRRIGFIKGPPDHRAAALRFDGLLDALAAGGVADPPWTAVGDFSFRSGINAAERLVEQQVPITALACANDDMAAGAMLALHRAGLDIPRDMSVSGFDDTPLSEVIWPPLTTVRQPIKQYTERAVQRLADIRAGRADEAGFERVAHRLVVRESTGAVTQPQR